MLAFLVLTAKQVRVAPLLQQSCTIIVAAVSHGIMTTANLISAIISLIFASSLLYSGDVISDFVKFLVL